MSRKQSKAQMPASSLPAGQDNRKELTAAWSSLNQTSAALRHIENRLQAVPGTGVLLHSLMDTKRTSAPGGRKARHQDGLQPEDPTGAASKSRARTRRSPDKSSRSPLRNSTLDTNMHKGGAVEFKEPLASYREASPAPQAASHLDSQRSSLPEASGSVASEPTPSQMVYRRDTRDQQTADLDDTRSSAPDAAAVRYLNDRQALDALRDAGGLGGERAEAGPEAADSSPGSCPGSASQRLENLRRRQPDDKLEKLKERIRRQREHLEEAAERDRLLGYLETPVGIGAGPAPRPAQPTARVRKVAAAPPAPIYKGFNTSETKIRTPDGKVWGEEEFHNLSREIYRDLTSQLTESTKPKQKATERGKERRPSKPVRKVHRSTSDPSADPKPAIGTSSWREGQKLVKIMLGPGPRLPRAESAERAGRNGQTSRSRSDPRPELNRRSRPSSGDRARPRVRSEEAAAPPSQGKSRSADRARAPGADLLSADIQGILDDLQLGGREEPPGREGGAGPAPAARPRQGARASRDAAPAKAPAEPPPPKRRHYDADVVRQYIARQQDERKRRQAEERRAQREETERKNQRLQELYRRQREGAPAPPPGPEAPAQRRLRETYTKLLLEQAELGAELPVVSLASTATQQPRPLYQPSGESDKENKRLDRPRSTSSSSDLSLTEQRPPALSRNDLGLGGTSWLPPARCSPALGTVGGALAPPAGQLFSQLLGLESEGAGPPPPRAQPGALGSRMSRIEALNATADSLSNRIESEARKLVGAGINYGCAMDTGTGLPAQPPDAGSWAKPASPPSRERAAEAADELALKIQRLLSDAGRTTYTGDLPGVGDPYALRDLRGGGAAETGKPRPGPTGGTQPRHQRSPPAPADGALDSSAGSISEGPLLSEDSASEGDASPPDRPKPGRRLGPPDYCAVLQNGLGPLSRFQREAEKYPGYSPPTTQPRDGGGPWEELAKGSPHSVINIFTKNLHGHSKVSDERGGRGSPALHSLSAAYSLDAMAYEDDFTSSRGSSQSAAKRTRNGYSAGSPAEELSNGRAPSEPRATELPLQRSPLSTPASSPRSASSSHRRGSDRGVERPLVDGRRSASSLASEILSNSSRRTGSEKGSGRSSRKGADTDSTLGGASVHSIHSLTSESKKSPRSPAASPAGSGSPRAPSGAGSPSGSSGPGASSSHGPPPGSPSSGSSTARGKSPAALGTQGHAAEPRAPGVGELHYNPGALHQRLSAELGYLDAMEESVRQLGDVERLRGVSLAQQEGVSLAQILKSQQQRHERELHLLKVRAEQEALESRRQLEESRQRAARAQAELQEGMVHSQQVTLGGLQETASKMLSQQAEAARLTADAARHIKEMTELTRSQMVGALSVPPPSITALYDQQRQQGRGLLQQLRPQTDTDSSSKTDVSVRRDGAEEQTTPPDSLSDSIPSRRPTISGGGSSSAALSLSPGSPGRSERGAVAGKAAASSSVEEEAHTAADESLRTDSVPSLLDEKADSASIATEYSLKFDESMTEDEIEERSFRSLLPSEAHRRGTLEKKQHSPHRDSDDDPSQGRATPNDPSKQDSSMPFSSGQDSFSRFTMSMVRQYMQEEEVRAQHQSSLLRLRHRALREKTKAELAWLEHQKRRLRDKGEDDKMPPIRKKQRGLILKMQQEQAEIRRLQEANRAARKERQVLLQQHEEIERMRSTTLKLKERLKCAGDPTTEPPGSDVAAETTTAAAPPDDTRSPSPVSVSGSETSSIMQKLKKMRVHMDEKFLTKREQQLMQRRRHAEELLEWRQRLDAEEAEVRRMEQQALAAWEGGGQPRSKPPRKGSAPPSPGSRQDHSTGPTDRDIASEDDSSPAMSVSSVHTELSASDRPASPSSSRPVTELPSGPGDSSPAPDTVYSQEFESSAESKRSPLGKSSLSPLHHPESSRTQARSTSRGAEPHTGQPHPAVTSGAAQDQNDIKSRIRALEDELRRRKSVAYQLKKEQKKRHEERLMAREASLRKQLESYNEFIQKTKAELREEPDSARAIKPQIKAPTSATEKPRIKPPPPQRPETSKTWRITTDSEKSEKALPDASSEKDDLVLSGQSKHTSVPEDMSSDEDPPTVTPTPVLGSPEHVDGLKSILSPSRGGPARHALFPEEPVGPRAGDSGDESLVSSHASEVMEELDQLKSEGSENEQQRSQSEQRPDILLKLDLEQQQQQQQQPSPQNKDSLGSDKDRRSKMSCHLEPKVEDSVGAGGERSTHLNESPTEEPQSGGRRSTEKSPSVLQRSNTTDLEASSKREDRKDTSSVTAQGYNDDFESSIDSSFRNNQDSKHTSPPVAESREKSYKSPFYTSDEEIDEELSIKSGTTNGFSHSGKLLELNSITKEPKEESKEDASIMKISPTPTPSHTPVSQPTDEMLAFQIGDRVLVSNVQPGTLRFKGQTNFANGFWAGVELDKSEGSNNGTYDGVAYFHCRDKHGIFAPPDKITPLPEKFEIYVDTTEDEDSSFDDQTSKDAGKKISDDQSQQRNQLSKKEKSDGDYHSLERRSPDGINKTESSSGKDGLIKSKHNLELSDIECRLAEDIDGVKHPLSNGRSGDIILEFEDASSGDCEHLINDRDKDVLKKQILSHEGTPDIIDLLISEQPRVDGNQALDDLTSVDPANLKQHAQDSKERQSLSVFADKLLDSFVKDAVKQFQQIRKTRDEKISAANEMRGDFVNEDDGLGGDKGSQPRLPFSATANSFRTFFDDDQEEASSPELCNRPESPVLGASGQEELAKRLAELELNRELLDVFRDDEDWFDEDFGLSSRKEQQKLKRQQQQEALSGSLSLSTGEAKTPPRPELPVQAKTPEEPVMIVPHSATEVEKLVCAAVQEIWSSSSLGQGHCSLAEAPKPKASTEFLGEDAEEQNKEAQCKRSYKQAVFDLSWEVIQDIFSEEPNANQPLWVKPRRVNSSYYHRVKCPGDITKVQEFVTSEVLKLYGLKKDHSQKSDWQKMLKFGRKKRDRVDHILVQELHEEESQWVNYDEDELFVKMQLADGIFDALLKDTADVLSQIQARRSNGALS